MDWWIGSGISLLCGILSAIGVGGGSLFLIYLIQFVLIEQRQAQLINLLVFIPTAICATLLHRKNGYVQKKTGWYTALFGLLGVTGGLYLSSALDPTLLKKLFGIFLAIIGLYELFRK